MKALRSMLTLLLLFLFGCTPEIDIPSLFVKHMELIKKGEAISQKELNDWIGEPDRIIKVRNLESEMAGYCEVKQEIGQWYFHYLKYMGTPQKDIEWFDDKLFSDSDIYVYFYETPLNIKTAYREWSGKWKPASGEVTLCFIKIDETYLAMPHLTRE